MNNSMGSSNSDPTGTEITLTRRPQESWIGADGLAGVMRQIAFLQSNQWLDS